MFCQEGRHRLIILSFRFSRCYRFVSDSISYDLHPGSGPYLYPASVYISPLGLTWAQASPITSHPSGRCPKIPQISKHGLGAKHRLPYLLRHRVEALMIHREIPGSRKSKMDLR